MLNGLIMKQLFSDGNSIQIEFRDELRNKRVYKTIIHRVTEEQLCLFLPEEKLIPIHPGTKLSVISYPAHESSSFYFTSEVIDYQPGNPSLLTIHKPAPIETVSRRKFFRCDVDLPFTYLDYENIEQKGTVINLSASGLMAVVFYDNHLKPSSHLECKLLLPTISESLKFNAKIIRIERSEREHQRALAMNFENITEKFQNDIIKYLFQRQRELIKLGHIKVGRI